MQKWIQLFSDLLANGENDQPKIMNFDYREIIDFKKYVIFSISQLPIVLHGLEYCNEVFDRELGRHGIRVFGRAVEEHIV